MQKYSIKLRVNDFVDEKDLQQTGAFSFLETVYRFHHRVKELIGGMICFRHCQLPATRTAFSEHGWLVEILCCCTDQKADIERKLWELR